MIEKVLAWVCAIIALALVYVALSLVRRSDRLAADERYSQATLDIGRAVFLACMAILIALVVVALK